EEEYLALEARFTKRERSGGSRVTTTIRPFATQLQELDRRFQANLDAGGRRDAIKRGLKIDGGNPDQGGDVNDFPVCKEEDRIEIWRDQNGWYQGRVHLGTDTGKDKAVEEFNGPQLPKMYERFWVN